MTLSLRPRTDLDHLPATPLRNEAQPDRWVDDGELAEGPVGDGGEDRLDEDEADEHGIRFDGTILPPGVTPLFRSRPIERTEQLQASMARHPSTPAPDGSNPSPHHPALWPRSADRTSPRTASPRTATDATADRLSDEDLPVGVISLARFRRRATTN